MSVKLISIPPNAEETILYCAKVSNPKGQNDPSPKLIKYLVDHQHWSPFEMVSLTMEINTSRAIARQILRHRSFSFQEFSQRYSDQIEFVEPSELRLQDTKNRQNSFSADDYDLNQVWWEYQNEMVMVAEQMYTNLIERGVAKELARNILPEGLTASKLYMAGTLRSWIHYCTLRTGNGTQKEHQEIAREAWKIISDQFPSIEGLINIES